MRFPDDQLYEVIKYATSREWEYGSNHMYCWVGKVRIECSLDTMGTPLGFQAWVEDIELDIYAEFNVVDVPSVEQAWSTICVGLVSHFGELYHTCVTQLLVLPMSLPVVPWDEPE